jgi:hypothetical protein
MSNPTEPSSEQEQYQAAPGVTDFNAIEIEGIESVFFESTQEAGGSTAPELRSFTGEAPTFRPHPTKPYALVWNTTVRTITNETNMQFRVIDQEDRGFNMTLPRATAAGPGVITFNAVLPWTDEYDEVATKAILFREIPPNTFTRRTAYFFQDYLSSIPCWLRAGIVDYGARNEASNTGGNLNITVTSPLPGLASFFLYVY